MDWAVIHIGVSFGEKFGLKKIRFILQFLS